MNEQYLREQGIAFLSAARAYKEMNRHDTELEKLHRELNRKAQAAMTQREWDARNAIGPNVYVDSAKKVEAKTELVQERPLPTIDDHEKAVIDKFTHKSGATSSHHSPFNFLPTYEGTKLVSERFREGNRKHENHNTVYSEANWLKAYNSRDVAFFRDRAGHALEHLIDEMRGVDDNDPGGNLGGIGWFVDVMAFVRKNDPFFYGAIQGKWRVDDEPKEREFYSQREGANPPFIPRGNQTEAK